MFSLSGTSLPNCPGQKAIKCPLFLLLLARFFLLARLQDHLLRHSDERAFQCATCGRRFQRQSSLVKHERLHMPDQATRRCEVCHVELAADSVRRHMLIHSGSKPYGCQWCDAAYRRKCYLRVHCTRVHGVELPSLRQKVERVNSLDNNGPPAVNNQDVEAVDALTLVASNETVVAD